MKESEKVLEAKLREAIKARGGRALKFLSQFHRGMPDRLVLLPKGRVFFVELKSTGRTPEPLQRKAHNDLRRLGFSVYVIDTTEKLQDLLMILDLEDAEI